LNARCKTVRAKVAAACSETLDPACDAAAVTISLATAGLHLQRQSIFSVSLHGGWFEQSQLQRVEENVPAGQSVDVREHVLQVLPVRPP